MSHLPWKCRTCHTQKSATFRDIRDIYSAVLLFLVILLFLVFFWRRRFVPALAGPQHRGHHPHQVMGRSHQGDLPPLGVVVSDAFEKGADGGAASDSLPSRLGQQLANGRRPFLGDVAQAVFLAGGVLACGAARDSKNQAKPSQTKPNQAKPSQTKPNPPTHGSRGSWPALKK